MKVNKKQAAQMVNIGRTTFYRHITEKPISVDENGKIDVSELIRVYGSDNVRTPEQLKAGKSKKTEQDGTQENTSLQDEIRQLKGELERTNSERTRERELLTEQIENLRENLKKSMEQNTSLTRLITDGREKEAKLKDQKQDEQEAKLSAMMEKIDQLAAESKKGFWKKVFG